MITVLMPLGGAGQPFRTKGQVFPKSLVDIYGHALVEYAIASARPSEEHRFVFVVREEEARRYYLSDVLELIAPGSSIFVAPGETGGALCTALLAIDLVEPDEPLLIVNGDQYLPEGLDAPLRAFRERDLDVGVITFEAILPRWSFARLNEHGEVVELAEKRPISNHATVGVYYYKSASWFIESAKRSLLKGNSYDGQFYICPSINDVILMSGKVGAYEIDRHDFFALGIPEDIDRFLEHFPSCPLEKS